MRGQEKKGIAAYLGSRKGSLQQDIEMLFYGFPDGSAPTSEGNDVNIKDREYFPRTMQGKEAFVISDAVVSRATGKPIVVMAVPMMGKDKVVQGMAAATITLDALSDIAARVKVGADGYGWIIDGKGIVLAHPDEKIRMKLNVREADKAGFSGLSAAAVEMTGGKTGQASIVRPDGAEEILFYAPIPNSPGWSFGVAVPRAQMLAPVYRLMMAFAIAAVVMVALTVLIVWLIAASIARGVLRHADTMLQSANYVRASSEQLAQASQGLAAGSSEQAASIEEISASLEEISGMTKQNADNAAQADKLTHAVIGSIDNAHKAMQKSLAASQEIARASGETQKIIKTIDEIAFQTNLLSLNAAVEAARAGEAGAGFAVVADEVRSLSMRSAEASRRTAELIEETITRVNEGVSVFAESGRAIDEVVEQSGKVQQLVSEIAAASNEQSKGIEQINRGVIEMEKVVQQTAANSEETASSSEELSAQAEEMHATVDRLVGFIGGAETRTAGSGRAAQIRPATRPAAAAKPVRPVPSATLVRPASSGTAGNAPVPARNAREITPEQIIPLDEEDMKDF